MGPRAGSPQVKCVFNPGNEGSLLVLILICPLSKRYTGSKTTGRKKLFSGRGKISISRSSNPPHGYNHGMKNGVCLRLEADNPNVVLIEGVFDGGLLADGEDARVGYADGTEVEVAVVNMKMDGVIMRYEEDIDPSSNLPRQKKRLCAVAKYRLGVKEGASWRMRADGVRIMERADMAEFLVAVPIKGKHMFR
jgi:hypothetical protein